MTTAAGPAPELGAALDADRRRLPWGMVIAVAAAVATGALLVVAPMLTFGAVVGVVVLVVMLLLGRQSASVFAIALGLLLTGYAFFDRGVAYVGTGSVFIGEGVLFLGILAFLLNLDRLRWGPIQWLIVLFMVIGLLRTVPYFGTYGQDALRDAVVWGYATFAILIASLVEVRWFEPLTRAYRWIAPAFLLWVPVATVLTVAFSDRLPAWPGAPVPIVTVKQGDIAVMLAGVAAFVLVGLYAARRSWMPSWAVWAMFFVDLAIVAAVNRGGFVATTVGSACALLFIRSGQRVFNAIGIALAGFVLLYFLNPSVDVGSNAGRNLSFAQLVENATSIVSSGNDAGGLDGTKAWRVAWWNTIIGYTIDGPYFWTGKGFGINLADADGFQVNADHSLREPHNGHLALLARGGVPLFLSWIVLQIAFGVSLAVAGWRARRDRRILLLQLIGVDFAIWVAALINMSFDVYLEGPQGGIWFWSVVGLGLVLMRVASTAPEPDEMRVLTDEPARSRRSLMPVPTLPAPAFALAGAGATLAPIPPIPLRVAPPPVEVADVPALQEAPALDPEAGGAVVQPDPPANPPAARRRRTRAPRPPTEP